MAMYDQPVQAQPDAPISLQLDHAEFAGKEVERCAACNQALAGSYYEINGRVCCAACHEQVMARRAARPGAAGFLRALGAGLAAGVAGAGIYFAVRAATGYNFSLISILVGYMVGRAVHWGVRGRGGWLYQTLAVLLTYLAIVSVYVPGIFATIRQREEARVAATASGASGASGASAGSGAAPRGTAAGAAGRQHAEQARPQQGPLRKLTALAAAGALLLMLAAALPFLGAINIIGLFIIAIGLFEAAKLNRRAPLNISGPHAITPPGWRA
jgi:hypothetical protein